MPCLIIQEVSCMVYAWYIHVHVWYMHVPCMYPACTMHVPCMIPETCHVTMSTTCKFHTCNMHAYYMHSISTRACTLCTYTCTCTCTCIHYIYCTCVLYSTIQSIPFSYLLLLSTAFCRISNSFCSTFIFSFISADNC